jgi:DNA-binding NtrC family response regulator
MAKILIVDDEETIRYAFKSFLTDEGHAVAVAGSIEEARQKIAGPVFDLIFADIFVGDRKGTEILRAIRERNLSCPVVMITGSPTLETASEAVRLGAFDYVPKPVRQQALLDITERALKHKALIDEKERYRLRFEAIFRSVRDAIITVDRDLVVTGNEAERSGSFPGRRKPLESFQRCFRKDCLDLLAKTIREGNAAEALRIECAWKDFPKRVVTIAASPLLDEQALTTGAVLVVKDETRLDRLERDMQERRQFHNIIGKAKPCSDFFLIEDLASVQTTALITGETGTERTGRRRVITRGQPKAFREGQLFILPETSSLSRARQGPSPGRSKKR